MPQKFYPASLFPKDKNGQVGLTIHGLNVNAVGQTSADAIAEAHAIAQELIDDLVSDGEEIPAAPEIDEVDPLGGQLLLFPVSLPGKSVRVNLTLDEELVRRIDETTHNRSAFVAAAARKQLADDRAEA